MMKLFVVILHVDEENLIYKIMTGGLAPQELYYFYYIFIILFYILAK